MRTAIRRLRRYDFLRHTLKCPIQRALALIDLDLAGHVDEPLVLRRIVRFGLWLAWHGSLLDVRNKYKPVSILISSNCEMSSYIISECYIWPKKMYRNI